MAPSNGFSPADGAVLAAVIVGVIGFIALSIHEERTRVTTKTPPPPRRYGCPCREHDHTFTPRPDDDPRS